MSLRSQLQDGVGRGIATIVLPVVIGFCIFYWWPTDLKIQEKFLSGFQKVAFVAAAFAITAYNLRVRVVDMVLKIQCKPAQMTEFCRIARGCGRRLTNLVVLFAITSAWLGGLTIFKEGTFSAQISVSGALMLFTASVVSFLYIVFSFERLERFAFDEAERAASEREASRLFKEVGRSDSDA